MSLFSANKLEALIENYKTRIGRRLTIREIAKETSISPAYLTLLKNGQRNNPSMDVVVKLSQFFQVAPESLLEDSEMNVPNHPVQHVETPVEGQTERTLQLCDQLISANSAAQALDLLSFLENSSGHGPHFFIDMQLTKARALQSLKRYEESIAIVEECLKQPISTHQQAKAYSIRGRVQFSRERYTQAIDDLLQAETLSEAANDQVLLYQARYMLGICFKDTHEYGSSVYYFESAQRAFPDSLPIVQKGHLLMGMGNTYLRLMSQGAAMKAFREAEAIYQEVGEQKFIADIRHNIARVKMMEYDYEGAIVLLEETLKMHQQMGDHIGIAADLLEIANYYKELRDWDKVQDYAFRASITYENGNMQGRAVRAKLTMIEAMFMINRVPDTALEMLEEIIKVFVDLEWHLNLAKAYHLKASLLQTAGQGEEALAMSMKALELYGKYAHLAKIPK